MQNIGTVMDTEVSPWYRRASMKREYSFAKAVNAEIAEQILKEVKELESVKDAAVSEDGAYITIEANEDQYLDAMTKALNISTRFTKNQWISFHRFVYDD